MAARLRRDGFRALSRRRNRNAGTGPACVPSSTARPVPRPSCRSSTAAADPARTRCACAWSVRREPDRLEARRAARAAAVPRERPNQDGAGVVDAVGPVTGLAVGDRVWVTSPPTSARPAPPGVPVLPADRVVPLPDGVPFEVGASLGVPAMTAHRALTVHEHGPTRLSPGALAGRTVLVQGGAGAVGHAAVQLAAGPAPPSSPRSAARPRRRSRAPPARTTSCATPPTRSPPTPGVAPDGVDHVVEVSPGKNAALDVEVRQPRQGRYYANDGGPDFTARFVASFAKNVRWQGLLLYTVGAGRCAPPPRTSPPPCTTARCRSARTPGCR